MCAFCSKQTARHIYKVARMKMRVLCLIYPVIDIVHMALPKIK